MNLSILVATPMYGGQCTTPYFRSSLYLKDAFVEGGVDHSWLIGSNESLITRARNSMAATFLETDFERLLFIDADIEFNPEDVAALWNMDEDVAVGVYAMKKRDADWYAAWVGGELVTDLDRFEGMVDVDYAGTGFMMIKRGVFEKLSETLPRYEGRTEEGAGREETAFFDTSVEDGTYLSEDYFFCKRWREAGGRVVMDPSIRLKHHGTYAYGS